MDNKVTSREEFIEKNFNTSAEEFDKRLQKEYYSVYAIENILHTN